MPLATAASEACPWTFPGGPISNGREALVVDTFLSLTDTLIHDFDTTDMLTTLAERSVELLDVDTAGVILVDGKGALSVVAASSENTRLLGAFAVAIESGPCVDCVRTGRPVLCDDLTEDTPRQAWPTYTQGAGSAGFRATHALPMRLRNEVIGVLTLLHTERHTLTEIDARLGQALADAATVGILHQRAVHRAETVREQLQGALDSRVVIEQAKGVIAHQGNLTPDDAFTVLRSHARNNGMKLNVLCQGVISGGVDLTSIVRPAL